MNKIVEVIFWLAALAVVFFINISPQALKASNPAYLIVFLVALLAIVSANFMPSIRRRNSRIVFSVIVYVVVFSAVILFFKGAANVLTYYYLPGAIAIAMAFLIIVRPKSSIAMLIAVCTFLLGEAFWSMRIGSTSRLVLPPAFLRMYSLALVAIFSYYLYARESELKSELESSNKRLRALDNMKSDFVANVSHELRTPLTSIKNACALLKKMNKTEDKTATELLDIVDANVDRQSRLVDDLLDLSKIEKGRAFAGRALIDIGYVARQTADSLAMAARAKDINFETDIEPNMPVVFASADQISEVYSNLLDNAIKYTEPGGTVSLRVAADKAGVNSIISDTGIGIKKEDIDKLFDRFKRLESILGKKTKGTGLGLAIVKEIIDLHQGRIWIDSQPGKGSKFIFSLPRGFRKGD